MASEQAMTEAPPDTGEANENGKICPEIPQSYFKFT
jgi:hypothetical protein